MQSFPLLNYHHVTESCEIRSTKKEYLHKVRTYDGKLFRRLI